MPAIRQEKLTVLPTALYFIEEKRNTQKKITLTMHVGRESEYRVYLTLKKSRGIAKVSSRSNEGLPCILEGYSLQRKTR